MSLRKSYHLQKQNDLCNNKKGKIKREGLYQDTHKGGLRMVGTEIMFKALNWPGFLDS